MQRYLPWVNNILFSLFQVYRIDLTLSNQRNKASPGNLGAAPMNHTLQVWSAKLVMCLERRTKLVLIRGRIDNDWPVHASRARRWATIQSTVPLRCTTLNDVTGDGTDTNAFTGVGEDI